MKLVSVAFSDLSWFHASCDLTGKYHWSFSLFHEEFIVSLDLLKH